MDDIPWIPIAMVFIAFLSWLRTRVQEASAIRRLNNEAKAETARSRRTTAPPKPAYESPYQKQSTREVVTETPKTFRELFDEINEQKEIEQAPAPVSRYSPPPLPPASVEVVEEDEEEPWGDDDGFGALATVQRQASVLPPIKKVFVKREKHPLAKILGDRNQLRNALILKEILSPPKALRSSEERNSRL